jgi:hypothetical protein
VPIEHARCSRCGTAVNPLDDLQTSPGSPLAKPVPKRRRISSHDLVPESLRREFEQIRKERAERSETTESSFRQKQLLAAITGAALTAFPMAVPGFMFLPRRSDAVLLILFDLLIGATAGSIVLRSKGGVFQGLFVFAVGFAVSLWAKVHLDYPLDHEPVAIAVLGSAVAASCLVACVVGVALDEH